MRWSMESWRPTAAKSRPAPEVTRATEVNVKYLAFRIDTTSIKDHKVVDGYFVSGQRSTDYNWPMLAEFDSMDAAKEDRKSVV